MMANTTTSSSMSGPEKFRTFDYSQEVRYKEGLLSSVLALATLIHVFPIVLSGYLILTRRWRVLGWTTATLLVGAIATIAFVGWQECVDFIAAIPSIGNASWNIIQRNLSPPVFIARLLRERSPDPGSAPHMMTLALVIAVDLLILAATTKVTIALTPRDDPDSRVFSLWVATAVFATASGVGLRSGAHADSILGARRSRLTRRS